MANITSLTVNGKKLPLNVDSQTSLLTVLRDYLNLTGTKYGCGESQCGACTVLVDGVTTRSCTMPVGKAAGKQITTIFIDAPRVWFTDRNDGFAEEGRKTVETELSSAPRGWQLRFWINTGGCAVPPP